MDRSVVVRLRAVVSDFRSGMAQAGSAVRQLREDMANSQLQTRRHVQDLSRYGLVAGGAVALGLGLAVGATMRFDKAMSAAGAATNANARELDNLRAAALQAGADTVFSATEAADAETELAKAGVSTADILAGALAGSLDLAAAGGLGVADAAGIAATAMTQFGLRGRDVTHIADLLAAGAGKAQGDVSDLALALKYVGPVAHQMGISIEETTGVLAELASQGILADQAGTSLRGMLSALTSPSQVAAAKMRELGINVYDARGNFVGFAGVAGQLQSRLGRLTNAERDEALGRIFGNEQITAARILYAGGAAAVRDWTAKVNDSGFASEQAGKKLDNLAGDLEALRGSLETALIDAGSGGTQALRRLTQAGTGAVNAFADLDPRLQETIVLVAGVSGAGLGLLGVLGSVIPRVQTARESLRSLGSAGQFADRQLGRVGKSLTIGAGVLAGLEAVGAALKAIQNAAFADVPGVEEIKGALVDLADGGDQLSAKLPALGADLDRIGGQVRRLADPSLGDKASNLFVRIFTAGQGSTAWLRHATEDLHAVDEALAGLVASGHSDDAAAAFRQIVEAAARGGASIEQVKEVLPEYRNALAGVANAAAGAGPPIDEAGRSTAALTGVARDATGQLTEYKSAAEALAAQLDALNGKQIGADRALIAWHGSLRELTGSVHDNGRALLGSSVHAEANRSAFIDAAEAASKHAQAVADETGSLEAGRAAFATNIAQLRAAATAAGLNKAQVDALIHRYAQVPAVVQTSVRANTAQAEGALARMRESLRRIRQQNGTVVHVQVLQDMVTVGTVRGPGAKWMAAGGLVVGPGGPTADKVPVMASNGEYVLSAATVRRIGVANLDAVNGGHSRITRAAAAFRPVPAAAAAGAGVVRLDPADRALLAAAAAGARAPLRLSGELRARGADLRLVLDRVDTDRRRR